MDMTRRGFLGAVLAGLGCWVAGVVVGEAQAVSPLDDPNFTWTDYDPDDTDEQLFEKVRVAVR